MNQQDTDATEPRIVERHTVTIDFTIDEDHDIRYWVAPDRKVLAHVEDNLLQMVANGAPFTAVAAALLALELKKHLAVEALERTEMRFRRLGVWKGKQDRTREEALEAVAPGNDERLH